MLRDIVAAEPTGDYVLHIRFDDGSQGDLDLSGLVGTGGVFDALRDPAYFRRVEVNRDLGTICWPNGADLCPDAIHRRMFAA